MDEATASIDVNTERIVQKLIQEEFRDSTVITVAHRLNTVMKSDKILVLSFGEVSHIHFYKYRLWNLIHHKS